MAAWQGRPLEADVQAEMEQHFGADFLDNGTRPMQVNANEADWHNALCQIADRDQETADARNEMLEEIGIDIEGLDNEVRSLLDLTLHQSSQFAAIIDEISTAQKRINEL